MFSPDGRWLAYSSNRIRSAGNLRASLSEAARASGRSRLRQGGLQPIWSRARNELFYLEPVSGQIGNHDGGVSGGWAIITGGTPTTLVPDSYYRQQDRYGLTTFILTATESRWRNRLTAVEPQKKPVFVFNLFDELKRASRVK